MSFSSSLPIKRFLCNRHSVNGKENIRDPLIAIRKNVIAIAISTKTTASVKFA